MEMLPNAKKLIGKHCKIRLISGINGYGKLLGVSDIGVLIQRTEDFHVDGYCLYVWASIQKIAYGKQEQFFEKLIKENLTSPFRKPRQKWLADFPSFFSLLHDELLMLETKKWQLFFCKIIDSDKKQLTIKDFDSYAQRAKKEVTITYTDIFCVDYQTEYLTTFKKYLK